MKVQLQKTYFLLLGFIILYSIGAHSQVLNMTPGSHFVINGTPSVILNNAAIKNNGTFAPGSGTVSFTGYSDTTVSYVTGDSTTTITNLSVNKSANGVALKSAVGVTNVLTMQKGNLYADSQLTLISTANNTARVAPVPSNSKILGKATVQRYIPGRRSWRLITAPVTNSNSIYNSWQNGGVYTQGVGTLITGANASSGNGLDVSPQNSSSMKAFNYNTQGLTAVSNTKTPISPTNKGNADNVGYFVFVRGDRDPNTTNTGVSNNTTLSSSGLLQTGDQVFTASSVAGKYTLIGNPYASPIDFNNVTLNNIIKRFYVWDPTLNQVGGYVVLDDITNSGMYIKSVSRCAQTNEIQSGQAFFVQTLSTGSASLIISESSKSTTNNLLVFRPAATTEAIITNLYLLNSDSSITYADGAVAQFNDAFNAVVDWQDATKFANTNEGIGILRGTSHLSIERRPIIAANDTVFLKLSNITSRNYQFEIATDNMQQEGLVGKLVDKYLGISTPLNLYGSTKVNFSVTSDVASAVATRFMIVFTAAGTLPVTFTTVQAYQKNTGILVDWKVENELNILQYEVEHSADGKNFSKANVTIATGNNNSSVDYNWLDVKPFSGDNYYRIKSVEKNGTFKYSQVVRVAGGSTKDKSSAISVYPNPVTGSVMNIQFDNQPQGEYMIHLVNDNGQLVYVNEVSVNSNNTAQALMLPSSLGKGSYELKVNGPGNKETTQKILIQ